MTENQGGYAKKYAKYLEPEESEHRGKYAQKYAKYLEPEKTVSGKELRANKRGVEEETGLIYNRRYIDKEGNIAKYLGGGKWAPVETQKTYKKIKVKKKPPKFDYTSLAAGYTGIPYKQPEFFTEEEVLSDVRAKELTGDTTSDFVPVYDYYEKIKAEEGMEELTSPGRLLGESALFAAGLTGARMLGQPLKKAIGEEVLSSLTQGVSDLTRMSIGAGKKGVRMLRKGKELPVEEPIYKTYAEIKEIGRAERDKIKASVADEIKEQAGMKIAEETGIPKYAGSINLERMNIPVEQKELLLETAKKYPKTVQAHTETVDKARSIYKSYDKMDELIKKTAREEALNPQEMTAMRQLNAEATKSFHELIQTTGEKEIPEKMGELYERIFKARSKASSIAGRTLEAHKMEIPLDNLGRAFADLSQKQKKNPRIWKEFKELNLDNPLEVMEFIQRIPDPKFRDYFYEYWYNSILSGVPTHLVNVASNTGWLAFQVPHRALKAGIDSVITKFTGAERQYFFRELVPMMAGMKTGFAKGKKGAWEMIKTGRKTAFETKWSREIGSNIAESFARSPHPGLRKIAPYITSPSRALRAMDVWANSISYDAQLRVLATREGIKKGLKGQELQVFEKALVEKPTKAMKEQAEEFAQYATFMDEPGKITSAFLRLRETVPGGRLVVPFVNTLVNLTKRGAEMTPGLGVVTQLAGRKMGAKHTVHDIIAKQIEGCILSYFVLEKAGRGEIVGAAPENEAERETFYAQGKIPWSLKVGDEYYSFRRVEPFNTVLASASIYYDKIAKAPDDKTREQLFLDFTRELKNNLIDAPYFTGVQAVLDRHQKLEKMAPRLVGSLVPFSGFWRSINRAYEAEAKGKAVVRDSSSMLGALSAVIPGLDADPKLGRFGEKKEIPGGGFRQFLPYKWSEIRHDEVEDLFMEIGYHPGMPKKGKMTDEEYGEHLKEFGRITRDMLQAALSDPSFRRLDKETKIGIVDGLVTRARRYSKRNIKK